MKMQPSTGLLLCFLASVLHICIHLPFLQLVHGQGESVSLDCGGDTAFRDNVTNVWWTPDNAYITTGSPIGPSNLSQLPAARELWRHRSFDNTTPRKNCYTIPVTSRPYLIRAGFLTPTQHSLPLTFQLAIDSTMWVAVNMSGSSCAYYEAITAPPTNPTLSICLIRTNDLGLPPFISSLELRPLEQGAYTGNLVFQGSYHMYLASRANFGGENSTIRSPDDPYDRMWPPYRAIPSLSMESKVVELGGGGECSTQNSVPSKVLQTAITASNFNYTRTGLLPQRLVLGIQYFCELDATLGPQHRTFTWFANFSQVIQKGPDDPVPDKVMLNNGFSIKEYLISRTIAPASITLGLEKDPDSDLYPILNADEVYYLESVAVTTSHYDLHPLLELKEVLQVSHWVGDPCLPVPWDELSAPPCIHNAQGPARVQSLDLSGKNLSGPIPPSIKRLKMLTTLRLNDNSFTGKIPDLNLSALSILDLSNNRLTGLFPAWLKNPVLLSSLKILDISNNDLTGTFPAELIKRLGSGFKYSGNSRLVCEDDGSGLCVKNTRLHRYAHFRAVMGKLAAGIAGLLIAGLVALWLWVRHQRRAHNVPTSQRTVLDEQLDDMSDSLREAKAKYFPLAIVKEATQQFSRKLGHGGFGPVYYGMLEDGQEVAVKILSRDSHQGHHEFLNEIELLSAIHHKNLVSLVGYCKQGPELILLYEYMPGGDLFTRLQHKSAEGEKKPSNELTWKTRLEIALGAASGLEYLHHGCMPRIIHRDVKSSNILLSDTLEGKVADFGLSKRGALREQVESHYTTNVKGTTGYLDPEYLMSGQLTDKSDVYSFGVVLLEILTGRSPVLVGSDIPVKERGMNIIEWVPSHLQNGNLAAVMDPSLAQAYNVEGAWKAADMALRCVERSSKWRPDMHEVVHHLSQLVEMEMLGDDAITTTFTRIPLFRSLNLATECSLDRTSDSLISTVSAR